MLLFDGKDIRYKTLFDRLRLMNSRLPQNVRMKPYRFASSEEDARVAAQALFEEKTKECDGIIVLNSTDSYEVAPIKYKDAVTCDFMLESAAGGKVGTFVLLAEQIYDGASKWHKQYNEKRGVNIRLKWKNSARPKRLQVFRYQGSVVYVRITHAQRRKFGLPDTILRSDAIVAEFRKTKNSWLIVKLRPDRKRPNNISVVTKNMEIAQNSTRASFLRSLPLQNDFHICQRWLEACARCVTAQCVKCKTIVEIGGCVPFLFLYNASQRVICYEPDTKKRTLLLEASKRCRAQIEVRPYAFLAESDVQPEVINAFFNLEQLFFR